MTDTFQLWISALAGTIVGFGLAVGYDFWKEWRRTRELIAGIREELRSNLYMFPMKLDTAKRALVLLSQGQLVDTQSTPFMRQVFDTDPALLSSALSPKERNLLHLMYDRFAAVDKAMSRYTDDITDMRPTNEQMVVKRYQASFGELEQLFADTENLIQSFLAGNPVDVFHLGMKWDEYKSAQISSQRPPPSQP